MAAAMLNYCPCGLISEHDLIIEVTADAASALCHHLMDMAGLWAGFVLTLTGFLPAAGCACVSVAFVTNGRKDRTVDTRFAPMPATPVCAGAASASSAGPSLLSCKGA